VGAGGVYIKRVTGVDNNAGWFGWYLELKYSLKKIVYWWNGSVFNSRS